ncbi:MAG TPA: peptidoglycan-associated lipoprotein Pal [Rhizobiales bacterium]|nr:peptidoglycan-associated lipoprotein Pal [Hyphomicrobiales bacterium]
MFRKNGYARTIGLVGVFLVAAGLAACSKKPQQMALGQQADGPISPGTSRDFSVNAGDKVYFTVNSSQLTPDAQATLRGQAQWLGKYPQYSVTLEGHADERGTREYNIALGARRASAVRTYLSGLGVNPGRLRTISYGKERPVAVCNDISCWSQNRRAVTVLNARAGS